MKSLNRLSAWQRQMIARGDHARRMALAQMRQRRPGYRRSPNLQLADEHLQQALEPVWWRWRWCFLEAKQLELEERTSGTP